MFLLPPWAAEWEEAAAAAQALLQDPCPGCLGQAQGREGAVGAAPHSTAHTGPQAVRGAGAEAPSEWRH